jgi:uncharacterized membrane protein
VTTVEQSIDVDVPVSTAYNQWTQFESFPEFMDGVREVRQMGDTDLHWVVEIAGVERQWNAEVTEQIPDERVAWTSRDGAGNSGVVTFHRLDEGSTRVMLQLEFEPHGVVEHVGASLGFVAREARHDLKRFKTFIEARGHETGAWRGNVETPEHAASNDIDSSGPI